jgi:hypothetical protein
VLVIGEVNTGLLQHSAAISTDFACRLLAPAHGMRVRRADRPIAFAVSPEVVTGIDCELSTPSGAKARVVGTTVSRTAITGGHVVQGSAFVRVVRAEATRRQPWSYYLARPGTIETIGKADSGQLGDGFLADETGGNVLDLRAIGTRAMNAVQDSPLIDHRPALKSSRTRLRWTADLRPDRPRSITFTVHDPLLRTIRLGGVGLEPESVVTLCEDLALHDWLLTTLLSHVSRAAVGTRPRAAVVARLQPIVDFLIHLWMPAARVDPRLTDVWEGLDRRPGLSRQWQATVDRVRDQVALAMVETFTPAGTAGARDDARHN